ncbi:hypothetical protein SBRCBS47491_009312 [Sporothrix bragantina]|uniref:Uncharacterized protein n=1 Tax=Sporothrix bragantina TaxID=671064 RepID=A0ABP0CU97_9PEZI
MAPASSSTASSTIATATCPPGNSLPEITTLPIPLNVSVVVIPGSNASDPAMVACCSPNPVSVVEGCYEWCHLPQQLNNDYQWFDSCLVMNGRNINKSSITGFHSANAALGRLSPTTTVAGLGVWALVVSGLAGALFCA